MGRPEKAIPRSVPGKIPQDLQTEFSSTELARLV
jgi:hypothetical protein